MWGWTKEEAQASNPRLKPHPLSSLSGESEGYPGSRFRDPTRNFQNPSFRLAPANLEELCNSLVGAKRISPPNKRTKYEKIQSKIK